MIDGIIRKIKERGIKNCIIFALINYPHKLIYICLDLVMSKLPIKRNIIVFSSTPDYSDNSKALYDYYIKKYPAYKAVWLLENSTPKDYAHNKNTKTIFVKSKQQYLNHMTLKALFYCHKASVIYYTHTPIKIRKPKNKQQTTIVNLWHGCGFKDNESNRKRDMGFDLALVPGELFIDAKAKFWSCEKEKIIPIGYPRYDLLLQKNNHKEEKKRIIWMPTFRKSQNRFFPESSISQKYDLPALSGRDDLIKINNLCKSSNIELIIKRHPFQQEYDAEHLHLSNISFLSNNDLKRKKQELYSLLANTDGLITDYSSVSFDYLLIDKPIAYILDDYEEYREKRGFIFKEPQKYMAGHHIYATEDILKFIKDIANNKDTYATERHKLLKKAQNPTNNYCQRIIDYIENYKLKGY